MVFCMKKKTKIAPIIIRAPTIDVIQDARLFPTSDQKLILHPPHDCHSNIRECRIKPCGADLGKAFSNIGILSYLISLVWSTLYIHILAELKQR